jgi:hypothetical protein
LLRSGWGGVRVSNFFLKKIDYFEFPANFPEKLYSKISMNFPVKSDNSEHSPEQQRKMLISIDIFRSTLTSIKKKKEKCFTWKMITNNFPGDFSRGI